jgi:hypothetical protein
MMWMLSRKSSSRRPEVRLINSYVHAVVSFRGRAKFKRGLRARINEQLRGGSDVRRHGAKRHGHGGTGALVGDCGPPRRLSPRSRR